jgi:hypothetical protein
MKSPEAVFVILQEEQKNNDNFIAMGSDSLELYMIGVATSLN